MTENISAEFIRLVEIIKKLRDPKDGCPWDKEQTHLTLKQYLIEEAYEVLDAIDSAKADKLREELGDLLLQVVLHAQIASDSGEKAFNMSDICQTLSDKLIRRHPHIFADTKVSDSSEVKRNWENIKQSEKKDKKDLSSALSGVPSALPALLKAARIGEKAARLGFDWQNIEGVKNKVLEELTELEAEENNSQKQQEEFGDLLFTLAQWARHKKIDPEESLRLACQKFMSRFEKMEDILRRQDPDGIFEKLSAEEKEQLWEEAKHSSTKL